MSHGRKFVVPIKAFEDNSLLDGHAWGLNLAVVRVNHNSFFLSGLICMSKHFFRTY